MLKTLPYPASSFLSRLERARQVSTLGIHNVIARMTYAWVTGKQTFGQVTLIVIQGV